MRVRIELDGLFGVGARFITWPGFSAHAVEYEKPFLSETAYRSFLGIHADLMPGMTPDAFAGEAIAAMSRENLRPARDDRGQIQKMRRGASDGPSSFLI